MIGRAAASPILLSFRLRPTRPSLQQRDFSHIPERAPSLSMYIYSLSLLSRWLMRGMIRLSNFADFNRRIGGSNWLWRLVEIRTSIVGYDRLQSLSVICNIKNTLNLNVPRP